MTFSALSRVYDGTRAEHLGHFRATASFVVTQKSPHLTDESSQSEN
ncbi:MAG: hypothetical protein JWN53_268 [Gemmatimonadetes bacterium]|nr:hypothetical protein [Gemmatimonadota bacterium]